MYISKKEKFLIQRDKKFEKIINKNGHIVFKKDVNQFNSLVEIVISQFISTKASNSIISRIKRNFNTDKLNEKHFESLSINDIKKLGLSKNKAKSINELTKFFLNNENMNLKTLDKKKLYEVLISIYGIGPWSINMFEIFSLGDLDVFSSKDAALRLAMNIEGMVKEDSSNVNYDQYALKWSPYRTVACLHLWKLVD